MLRIVPAFSFTAALLITAAMFAASNPPRFYKPTEISVWVSKAALDADWNAAFQT